MTQTIRLTAFSHGAGCACKLSPADLRTVLGLIGIGAMRAIALLLRVFGNGMRHIGTLLERLYDLPLFVPLWIESQVSGNQRQPTLPEEPRSTAWQEQEVQS